jgi:hypothetical protein
MVPCGAIGAAEDGQGVEIIQVGLMSYGFMKRHSDRHNPSTDYSFQGTII